MPRVQHSQTAQLTGLPATCSASRSPCAEVASAAHAPGPQSGPAGSAVPPESAPLGVRISGSDPALCEVTTGAELSRRQLDALKVLYEKDREGVPSSEFKSTLYVDESTTLESEWGEADRSA